MTREPAEFSPKSWLPDEILIKIFSFVRVSDLAVLSLVCRKWYNACQDPSLWKDAKLRIFASQELFSKPLLKSLERKRVRHVFLCRPLSMKTVHENLSQVCEYIGHNLLSLSASCYEFHWDLLVEISNSCPQLRILHLKSGPVSTLFGSKNASALEKVYFPELNEFSIEGSFGSFKGNSALTRILVACGNVTNLRLVGNHTFRGNLEDILGCCSRLLVLDLTKTHILDNHLQELASFPGLRLRELNLTACLYISDAGVIPLVTTQTSLEVLTLRVTAITDYSLIAIGEHLHKLQWLDLRSVPHVTSTGVQHVAQLLPTLEYLNIHNHNPEYSAITLMECFKEFFIFEDAYCFKLSSICLGNCRGVNDGVVSLVVKNLKYLREIDLELCDAVSDASLDALTENAKLLEILKMNLCKLVTDKGLLGTCDRHGLRQLKRLHQLELSECIQITDKGLQSVYGLVSLRVLNVSRCSKITDVTLLGLARHNKPLQHLNLRGLKKVTDEGICELSLNLGCLETLDIAECSSVTKNGLLALAENCYRLTYLNVPTHYQRSEKLFLSLKKHLPMLSGIPEWRRQMNGLVVPLGSATTKHTSTKCIIL